MHCPKLKRTKWSAKAKKAIFVGYDKNTKGYRIWLPSEGQVKVYRDVKFLPENLPAEKEEKTQKELAEIRLQELAKDEEDDPENNDEQDSVSEENEQENESPSENGKDDLIDFRDDHQQPAGEKRQLRNRDVLRRPARFGDYELDIASTFLADSQEPSNYEEAVSSIES